MRAVVFFLLGAFYPTLALAELKLCAGVWTNRGCEERSTSVLEERKVEPAIADELKSRHYRSVLTLAEASRTTPSLAKVEAEELRAFCQRREITATKCEARAQQVRKTISLALERERKAELDRERLRIEHKKLEQRNRALAMQEKRKGRYR